ncbi:TIGR03792 family protein [Gloeocapsopsis dulcis]|uniref:Cyanobacterial protein, TIGR03792 family n=1 Tax=Gloeocapsopsis dulcis AAB1 = 1H9 TaxID=1433147 RepID=A0A6N8G1N0_9CHRO|nr:TIGR03792 family protein [Gloeocapsopsis dulcis]MUL38076.1 cyanobacterial protein, TIGR03792 family [Gloeocapsopsis dulcis AAB1 = 1H9]WNN91763.1 TIGR03792 family protein [Gloeocapsopsis dulcis]
MVIELLKYQVDPDLREQYLQLDAEVWTKALAQCPGFLGKEVWLNPEETSEVVFIIRWATKEDWKSIPKELLHQVEQKFAQQMGRTYQIVESAEYQVYTPAN